MKNMGVIMAVSAVGLLLASRSTQAKTAAVAVGTGGQKVSTITSPPTVAQRFGLSVLAEVLRTPTAKQAAETAAYEKRREDAARAVRAGDPYYGEGANAWSASQAVLPSTGAGWTFTTPQTLNTGYFNSGPLVDLWTDTGSTWPEP